MGHIHRDGVLRLNRKRAGLRTQFSDFLLRADEHRNIAFQLVLCCVQLLHRQQDGGNARSVVKALAAKLTARRENRDPLGVEQDACIGYLRRQVALLRPKIIVCLGRIAAMRIIKPDFKITREHGQWFEKNGFQMMAVYHPAALLRDPRRRPESFEDFKGLQQKINELCEHTHAVS